MATSAPPSIAVLPSRRTQAERREASGARLLAAAATIIAREGYLAATLERVGAEAGFSRGLASRKYGSKDGLIEAVIWRVSDHVNAQVDLVVAGFDQPLDKLLALFDRFVELVQDDVMVRAYFVLFSAMIANRLETRQEFDQVQQRFGERIEGLILAAQLAGQVGTAVPARHAAYLVGCLLAGISIETVMGENADEADPLVLRRDLGAMLRRALMV